MYSKILVPVDLSDAEVTKGAVEKATALAAAHKAQLRIMNVLSLIPAPYIDYMPANFDSTERERTVAELEKTAAAIALPAGQVSSTVRMGAVYHEVLGEAKDWGADLIVIGSHHPTLATYLIGSNAANIVRHADCSVLVVR